MKNIVALVDCNNFYASCERLFRPELEGKPIIVLANNDGCVVARSNEAKALCMPFGKPVFEAEHLIKKHNIYVFSSNYTLYGDMSHRVMQTLEQFSPDLEIYSIDEAFLDLTGFADRDLTEYGWRIKNTVTNWTGIPVSIGIAETKTLAKVANRFAKKNKKYKGVLDITSFSEHEIDEFLKQVDVSDIWGVGWQYEKLLKRNNFHTAYDLKYAPDKWVKKNMTVMGLATVFELRGTPSINLEEVTPHKKEIVSSCSFGRPVETLEELEEAVATYVTTAAEKLRKQKCLASLIQVFVATNRFRPKEPQYSNAYMFELPEATDSTAEFISHAHENLKKIFREGYRYKKAGVMLSGIVEQGKYQLNLFTESYFHSRNRKLTHIIDNINEKWGSNTLHYAATGIKKPWMMKRMHKSPHFTTQWDQILVVKTDDEKE